VVIKKSGDAVRFSRMKLYSGIYGATIGSKVPNREIVVEKLTREVENKIQLLKKKRITSQEIADVVLKVLRKRNASTFMRFLSYHKNLVSEDQMKRALRKYS